MQQLVVVLTTDVAEESESKREKILKIFLSVDFVDHQKLWVLFIVDEHQKEISGSKHHCCGCLVH